MAIGTSNGKTYEDEFEQVKASFESPVTSSMPPTMPPTAPTELLDELKPDQATLGTPNSRVKPSDPSVDSFKSRWGEWDEVYRPGVSDQPLAVPVQNATEPGTLKVKPGSPVWPSGNVISDADYEGWIEGQHYAADIRGRGSDLSGPYMHQPTYSEEHKKSLDRRASILKGADPSFWDGDADFRRNNLRELLDKSQEERDADHQKFLEDWNSAPNTQKIDPKNYPPPEAGIFRIWKNVKGIDEFLKDLPDDVEAFDMDDGTVVLKKKAALTS